MNAQCIVDSIIHPHSNATHFQVFLQWRDNFIFPKLIIIFKLRSHYQKFSFSKKNICPWCLWGKKWRDADKSWVIHFFLFALKIWEDSKQLFLEKKIKKKFFPNWLDKILYVTFFVRTNLSFFLFFCIKMEELWQKTKSKIGFCLRSLSIRQAKKSVEMFGKINN